MTQLQTATVAGNYVRTRSSTEPASMPAPGEQLKASLRELLAVAMNRVAGFAMDKVDQAAHSLEDVAANGGPKIGAVLGGVEAKLAGNNPVWGAVKGAFSSLSPTARIGIALLLLLAVILLPVTLVLVLLGLLVLAVILLVSTRSPR